MLRKFIKLYEDWKYKIMISDNQKYIDKIKAYEKQLKVLSKENYLIVKENQGLRMQLLSANDRINSLEKQISSLKKKLQQSKDKHFSLETFKQWMDKNIKPTVKYYNFGKGRKRPHTIFAESIKDKELIMEFIEKDLGLKDWRKYKTADDLVFKFNYYLSKKFPTFKYYSSDKSLYGKIEYWATAREIINNIRKKGKYGDCDDSMTLRYSCLYHMLKEKFPNDLWRLRGFIVDIWTGGGHALLGWVKKGVNDWVPVETTFYNERFWIVWKNNYRIRNQMLYQIRYSFDNKNEYTRI